MCDGPSDQSVCKLKSYLHVLDDGTFDQLVFVDIVVLGPFLSHQQDVLELLEGSDKDWYGEVVEVERHDVCWRCFARDEKGVILEGRGFDGGEVNVAGILGFPFSVRRSLLVSYEWTCSLASDFERRPSAPPCPLTDGLGILDL